jgi:hypothetical protein
MFRRRRILRPIMPLPATLPTGRHQQVHPELKHAHDLMVQGQYPEAAALFSRIAEVAQSRGGPRAPFFYIQAGRAFVLAGEVEAGIASLREGLAMLAAASRWSELQAVGQVAVDQLTGKGYEEQAKAINDWLAAQLAGKPQAPAGADQATRQPLLPTRCPSCGAAVNAREVTWLDQRTAECLYCGGPIRAEG